MITKLFLNNYKGFKQTIISLKDVNFLVGDNSTGKTIVMNLLYIIDHNLVPFQMNLNKEVKLGGFDDIVNKYSADKSYFAFGCEKVRNGRRSYHCWRFKNRKGTSVLDEYKFSVKGKTVYLRFKNDDNFDVLSQMQDLSFKDWLMSNNEAGLTKVDENSDEMRHIMIDMIFNSEGDSMKAIKENEILRFTPVRANAKSYYDMFERDFSPEGTHIATFLKTCLERKNKKSETIIKTLNDFGKESSLFEGIEVEQLSDSSSSPFSLDMKYGKIKVNISNVGFGVSQVMPLVVEMLRRKKTMIAIPQPEVHLHPKAQCAFGTLVFRNWQDNNNQYLLETHSEYMINRFRYEMLNSEKAPKGKAQVLFFERNEDGNVITSMPIGENGKFDCEIPDSYGDFFVDEELKMLEL